MRFLLAAGLSILASPVVAQLPFAWSYHHSVGDSPLDTILALAFGEPETDFLQAHVVCSIGANWIYADMRLDHDVEGLGDGAGVALTIEGDGYSAVFEANVERQEVGISGVVFAVPLDDRLWTAMMRLPEVYYALPGHRQTPLLLTGFAPMAHDFLRDCRSIVDLKPDLKSDQTPAPSR